MEGFYPSTHNPVAIFSRLFKGGKEASPARQQRRTPADKSGDGKPVKWRHWNGGSAVLELQLLFGGGLRWGGDLQLHLYPWWVLLGSHFGRRRWYGLANYPIVHTGDSADYSSEAQCEGLHAAQERLSIADLAVGMTEQLTRDSHSIGSVEIF